MDQLLQIHTVPIQIEIVVTHAKVNISSQAASFNLNRQRGNLSIQHSYPKLHIDSSAARSSMNLKSPVELTRDFAQRGVQAAQDATEQAMQMRRAFLATQNKNSNPVRDFARLRIQHTAELTPAAIPSVPSQISWEPQQLRMQYQKDQLDFEWRMNRPEIECTPASIEFHIKQYPKIEIEYVGKPIYVPPSAAPDYEEDAQAEPRFQATA